MSHLRVHMRYAVETTHIFWPALLTAFLQLLSSIVQVFCPSTRRPESNCTIEDVKDVFRMGIKLADVNGGIQEQVYTIVFTSVQ